MQIVSEGFRLPVSTGVEPCEKSVISSTTTRYRISELFSDSLHKCISTRGAADDTADRAPPKTPHTDYHGPCAGMVDFRDMTTLQKKQWSSSCLAWCKTKCNFSNRNSTVAPKTFPGPCVETRPVELGPDADMPLTREAVRCNLS